ncbi:hypothetical protein HMPREF3167_05640 [Trueperella sp. HMSC08B05]|uniref:DUF4825 domain-containing protein n=1 Tax=Trueperella bernardiae TaxID=59561 RepID=A0A0W1KLF3_9ACTO|nr:MULTISPECIES: DUF4825 domain-containing protein [Trueperella]KTF04563.1 hypothetical protein AQZ59_00547 [Trueperella bernardiae]MDK8601817.1 DUF4825 domain-containing protein [Trueperella bernardiae]MDV6238426.1 DUF4825 domain-containing protein [Trueperella bernardiae]OCW60310.1 hypothetical protein AKG36_06170 [Trueperella bernardiae]OFS74327.1 hypothetical protein HMPREF3167_05640 [Trueperella sp. HMSC08B05]
MTSSSSRKSLVVQVLISIGLALIVIIGFTYIRLTESKANLAQVQSLEQQSSFVTHDINALETRRSPYVGDNSNTVQALYALPLGARIDRVEIHGTDVLVMLGEGDTGNERENVLYSAVAFMAAIDNATSLTYVTLDGSYYVERSAIEERFGTPLSDLLDSAETWQGARGLVPLEAGSLVADS